MGVASVMVILIYGVELLLILAVSIATIAGMWKIMVKAGYNGWESLIPFYNRYILFKLSGKKKLFAFYLGISIVMAVGGIIAMAIVFVPLFGMMMEGYSSGYVKEPGFDEMFGMWAGTMFYSILSGVLSIGILVLNVLMCIGLTESFGISAGYAVGLIFLPYVFYPIIGFSKNIQYICPGGNKNMNQNYPNQNYPMGNYPNVNNSNGYYANGNYANGYYSGQTSGDQYYQNGTGQNNGGSGEI
ncbi:MAG: DUF5684 domain-containing protein [Lachnospiraceae bacterium]|nr:DUF5684 domain-containing protein [Lachnospiraceae bacterium]